MNKWFGDWHYNRRILVIAIPIMIQMLITSSINSVDSLMVGGLGDEAIGGIAAANRFYTIMSSAVTSIIGASCIFIGQFYGANEHKKTRQCFNVGLISAYLIIAVFFVLTSFYAETIIAFFTDAPAIISTGSSYLSVIRFSFIPLGISLAIANALQAFGKTKIPLMVCSVSLTLKLGLNILLMNSLGVVGAGLASVLARVVEMTIYLIIVIKGHYQFLTSFKEIFDVPLDLFKRILKTAIPFTVNNFLWAAGNSYILKLFGTASEVNYNGYAIVAAITDLFNSLNLGFGNAISLLVAQKLGANNREKTERFVSKTYGLAIIVASILGVIMIGISFMIPVMYPKMSFEVISVAKKLMILQGLTYIFYEMGMQNYFIFKAGGDIGSIIIMDCIGSWLIRIPIIMLFAYVIKCDIYVLFLSSQIGEIIKMFISIWLVRQKRWINNLTQERQTA